MLTPRHDDHAHYINVKYGYIVLALLIFHITITLLSHHVYHNQWRKNNSRDWSRRLISTPLWTVVLVWSIILGVLIGLNIHTIAWSTLIKRFGRLSYSLLPLIITLSLRFPNAVFAQGYYLEFLGLHKWLGRISMLLGVLHGIGFGIKWIIEGKLAKAFELVNIYGAVVSLLLVVVLLISIRGLRRRFYQTFYLIHTITAWLFVILICLHARPGVVDFTILCGLLLAYQVLQRTLLSFKTEASVSEGNYLSVVKLSKPENFPNHLPGSHIRLLSSIFKSSHPFTLVSEDSTSLTLITRKANYITNYTLIGPFPALSPNFFATAKYVNIVCGGSGISFGIPILNHFHRKGVNANLTWFTPSFDETLFELIEDSKDVNVYVTGEAEDEGEGLLNIPMNELGDKSAKKYNIHNSRPTISSILVGSDYVESVEVDGSNSWVLACGPDGLVEECKRWAKVNDVGFFLEKYAA